MAGVALAAILLGLAYAAAVEDLPAPQTLPELLQAGAQWSFQRPRAVDRYGRLLVQYGEPMDTAGAGRRERAPDALPPELVRAFLAALDPDFERHQGVSGGALRRVLLGAARGEPLDSLPRSIPMRLAAQTLLPAEYLGRGGLRRVLVEAVLAAQLSAAYDKDQLLGWFLNNVPLGEMTFGVQQGAQHYFGKDADDLTLAESVALAALARQPELAQGEQAAAWQAAQAQILRLMQQRGWVEAGPAAVARGERLVLGAGGETVPLAVRLWRAAGARAGAEAMARAGLVIVTTLDARVQTGVDCLMEVYARGGGRVGAAELEACPPAARLPLPRPAALQSPLEMRQGGLVVLNPRTGEILATWGSAQERQPLGSASYPLIYLAAFARGFSPASMVLDIPAEDQPLPQGAVAHGPVTLRQALRAGYPLAARRLTARLGEGYIARLAQALGWTPAGQAAWEPLASVEEAAFGFSALANLGNMTGAPRADKLGGYLIDHVEDASGALLYQVIPQRSAVLSPQLAYLLLDVLSDPLQPDDRQGRMEGQAILLGAGAQGSLQWAIGMTPERVIALRLEGGHAARLAEGALALIEGLLDAFGEVSPASRWQQPPGLVRVRVCLPSGLLPTSGCPRTRQELFLEGTEPTHQDTAYRSIALDSRTGGRATAQTPLRDLEVETFFLPPEEARPWLGDADLRTPPRSYAIWQHPGPGEGSDRIQSPAPFAVVSGQVPILGTVAGRGLRSYRLEYGRGLLPERWHLITEKDRSVHEALLGTWQTEGLDGLYVLRLMAVREQGRVEFQWLPLVVDNEPPQVALQVRPQGRSAWVRVEAQDNLALDGVEIYLDGRLRAAFSAPPYVLPLRNLRPGRHVVAVLAYDQAGHMATAVQRWQVEVAP